LPTPESPHPSFPAAVAALALFVDAVLAKNHDRAREEPDSLLFQDRGRDRLCTPEVGGELLKPVQKHATAFPKRGSLPVRFYDMHGKSQRYVSEDFTLNDSSIHPISALLQ
jgi:hypothetical protein